LTEWGKQEGLLSSVPFYASSSQLFQFFSAWSVRTVAMLLLELVCMAQPQSAHHRD
jgi:hypothetical protein